MIPNKFFALLKNAFMNRDYTQVESEDLHTEIGYAIQNNTIAVLFILLWSVAEISYGALGKI